MRNDDTVRITGMELTLYTDDGQNIAMSLTETQQDAVGKILGLNTYDGEKIVCFSDNGLKKIMAMTLDKWKGIKNENHP